MLIDHLWQSTLFVVVAWLLTLILRNNAARVRYWVWFAASIKFLIPFSLLAALGSQLSWREAAMEPMDSGFLAVMQEVTQPLRTPEIALPSADYENFNWPLVILAIWAAGSVLVLAR